MLPNANGQREYHRGYGHTLQCAAAAQLWISCTRGAIYSWWHPQLGSIERLSQRCPCSECDHGFEKPCMTCHTNKIHVPFLSDCRAYLSSKKSMGPRSNCSNPNVNIAKKLLQHLGEYKYLSKHSVLAVIRIRYRVIPNEIWRLKFTFTSITP